MSYHVGIDIGGTNIKAGLVNDEGTILKKLQCPTNSEQGSSAVIEAIATLYFKLIHEANLTSDEIETVGVGCPGSINKELGIVEFSNNLNWYGVRFSEKLSKLIGKEIFLENDANAAAFGEHIAGSLSDYSNAILLTLGTGVGSGIILNGKIYSGFNSMGGEIGHMVICHQGNKCTCGRHGCFEAYASATAFIDLTKKKMQEDKASLLWELCSGDIEKVDGVTAFSAYSQGDKTAVSVIEEYADYLASGIISICNIFQPEAIALGGGLSGSGDILLPLIQKRFNKEVFTRHTKKQCIITTALCGNAAGIIGSAMLWKTEKGI